MLNKQDLITNGTYASYLKDEAEHLNNLRLEPLAEQSRFNYVAALENLWAAQLALDAASTKHRARPSLNGPLFQKLPAPVSRALFEFNEAQGVAMALEKNLEIAERWTANSEEYKEARKWANMRKYRLALDKLERLMVQRLFELQKANLVSTGTSFFIIVL